MKLDEIQGSIRRAVLGEAAAAKAATVRDVDRWPPMPGQTKGDAKDPLTRIREQGFDPDRFRDDPEYAGRPQIRKLAEEYVKVAAPRQKAAETAEMVATSKYVAAHKTAMQSQLRRAEIDRAIAKLTAERDTLHTDDDEDEGPEDEALARDEAAAALPEDTEAE
jgi:hypothetical protein